MLVELILGLAISSILWYFLTRLPSNYPPTPPIRLPILGHAHYFFWIRDSQHGSALYQMFKRFSKNNVLTLHVGTQRVTMIGSHKILKDLFSKEETNSRSNPIIIKTVRKARNNLTGMEGVIWGEGKTHHEQRKFMLTTLRDFGFGKSDMENLINDEVHYLCECEDETIISAINKEDNMFMIPVLNVLWKIVAGERYDYKDPRMKSLMSMLAFLFETNFQKPDVTWFMPFLAKVFPKLERRIEGLSGKPGDIRHFLIETIQNHKDTLDVNNIRDFIDAYLIEIMEKENIESSFNQDTGYEQLLNVLMDLFLAGTDTTSLTMTYGVIYLTNNQLVQDRLREDILQVVGKERQPSLKDRSQMHYTEATILEIQRHAIFGPEGFLRVNKAPLVVGNYAIPSGHMVVPCAYEIFMGESSWKDPKKFDPTRFIEDGKFVRDERVAPFQAGKRVCPGEGLARAELFLFLVGLIQKFKFEPEGPGKSVNYTLKPGFTWKPHRHDKIKVTRL